MDSGSCDGIVNDEKEEIDGYIYPQHFDIRDSNIQQIGTQRIKLLNSQPIQYSLSLSELGLVIFIGSDLWSHPSTLGGLQRGNGRKIGDCVLGFGIASHQRWALAPACCATMTFASSPSCTSSTLVDWKANNKYREIERVR